MTQKILNILKVAAFLLPVVTIRAQITNTTDNLSAYTNRKYEINRHGMIVLTTWASVNILSGAGYFTSVPGHDKYFYAMNAAWGTVNLAIALPGLLSKKRSYSLKSELLKDQLKTEKIFLINAALDIVYIGGGFVLNEIAGNQTDINQRDMFSGFGDSFIMQGGGLLLFDTAMFLINRNHRKKHLLPVLQNPQVSFNGRAIKLSLVF